MKKFKKLVILIIAILITTFVGLIVPILMNRQPGDIVDDISKVSDAEKKDDGINTNELGEQGDTDLVNNEGINNIIITDKLNTPGVTQNPKDSLASPNADEKDKHTENSQTEKKDGEKEPDNDKVNDSQNQNTTKEGMDPVNSATPENNETKSWIDEKLDEYKDDIDPADIPDIKRIYSRIDVAYVQGLSENGMTDEAKENIKDYLRKTLGSDYERAKELFYMYSYLI